MLTLRQSYRTTRAAQIGALFTATTVVGSVGGSALPTDPNPNTTPPSNGRILRLNRQPWTLTVSGLGVIYVTFVPIATASITIQPWFFDATQNVWIQFVAPVSSTPTAPGVNNLLSLNVFNWGGAKFFLQITANTATQCMLYGWF